MRGGTTESAAVDKKSQISIHPPRAGRDHVINRYCPCRIYFNPPAPCGAGLKFPVFSINYGRFQSTRPVRGGTSRQSTNDTITKDFNPPAPCGAGRLVCFFLCAEYLYFNPPAPCGAGQLWDYSWNDYKLFQSTRPVRGGTTYLIIFTANKTFQSTRPVRGGTSLFLSVRILLFLFQSTRPVRGGTSETRR